MMLMSGDYKRFIINYLHCFFLAHPGSAQSVNPFPSLSNPSKQVCPGPSTLTGSPPPPSDMQGFPLVLSTPSQSWSIPSFLMSQASGLILASRSLQSLTSIMFLK